MPVKSEKLLSLVAVRSGKTEVLPVESEKAPFPVKPEEIPPVEPDELFPVKPEEVFPVKPEEVLLLPVKPEVLLVPVKPEELLSYVAGVAEVGSTYRGVVSSTLEAAICMAVTWVHRDDCVRGIGLPELPWSKGSLIVPLPC